MGPAGETYFILDCSLGELAVHLAKDLGPRLRTGCPVVRIDYSAPGSCACLERPCCGAREGKECSCEGCSGPSAAGVTLVCAGESETSNLGGRDSQAV